MQLLVGGGGDGRVLQGMRRQVYLMGSRVRSWGVVFYYIISYVRMWNWPALMHCFPSLPPCRKALDASRVSFTHLSKALGKIESSVSQAQAAYRVVLESYGTNPKLIRLYGKFLEKIKNDPWGAAEYFAEADRLEEVKNGDARGPLLPDGEPCGCRVVELSLAAWRGVWLAAFTLCPVAILT